MKISCALCPKLKYCVSDFFQTLQGIYIRDTESIRALMLALGKDREKIIDILIYGISGVSKDDERFLDSILGERRKKIIELYDNLFGKS